MLESDRKKPHSEREWLGPMAVIAAAQFGLWWILWAGGFAKQPMLQAYSTISLIGLGLAFIPFVLWYLFQIHRAGERQPLKRIRKDISQPNGIEMFVSGDQLLKGAALNAVQIAEWICKSGR